MSPTQTPSPLAMPAHLRAITMPPRQGIFAPILRAPLPAVSGGSGVGSRTPGSTVGASGGDPSASAMGARQDGPAWPASTSTVKEQRWGGPVHRPAPFASGEEAHKLRKRISQVAHGASTPIKKTAHSVLSEPMHRQERHRSPSSARWPCLAKEAAHRMREGFTFRATHLPDAPLAGNPTAKRQLGGFSCRQRLLVAEVRAS